MTDPAALSDQELMALIKLKDHLAFIEIYDRYKGLLYIHALKLLKDQDDAQDVVQELFTVLWQKAEHLNLNIPFRAYLYKALRNRIFDIFSRQKISAQYISTFVAMEEKGEWITEEQIREKELIGAINDGLALMPLKMRTVFEMSRMLNMSHKEIAAELNISDKTVKTQINNAIRILRLKIKSFLVIF